MFNIGSKVKLKCDFPTEFRTFEKGHIFEIIQVLPNSYVLAKDYEEFIISTHIKNIENI